MCKTEVCYRLMEGFVHRKIGGNDVLVSVGANVANFNGYITLNPVASFLVGCLAQPQSVSTLTNLLTEEFDVSQEKAKNDVEHFLEMLLHNSMVKVYEES